MEYSLMMRDDLQENHWEDVIFMQLKEKGQNILCISSQNAMK